MEIDISKYPAYLKHDLEELINAEKMESCITHLVRHIVRVR